MDVDEHIRRINMETRDQVQTVFTQLVAKGMSMSEIADMVESPEFDGVFDRVEVELAELTEQEKAETDLRAIIASMIPTTPARVMQVRTVIDRDPVTGKVTGSHDEYVDVP